MNRTSYSECENQSRNYELLHRAKRPCHMNENETWLCDRWFYRKTLWHFDNQWETAALKMFQPPAAASSAISINWNDKRSKWCRPIQEGANHSMNYLIKNVVVLLALYSHSICINISRLLFSGWFLSWLLDQPAFD